MPVPPTNRIRMGEQGSISALTERACAPILGLLVSLAKKLNLKDGMSLRVFGKPKDVDFGDVKLTSSAKAEGVLVFVRKLAELDDKCEPLVEAAKADRLAWAAYPKAGQLATDLNRDKLWQQLSKSGIEGVRLVALDSMWSVMRFRPATAPRAKAAGVKAAPRVKAAPSVKAEPPRDPHFAKLVKALEHERGVSYGGKGFGSSALKVDGRIFAMVSSKGQFVVKLSKARVDELVAADAGSYFDPGRGRLMKEWLAVSAPPKRWLPLAKEALAFGRQG